VLIIQGIQDERVPVGGARQVAEILGDRASYVEVEGDHFMIIKQPARVQDALAGWLESREAMK
jgi:pimeloyl-ACP methyl ester carboxylesterase